MPFFISWNDVRVRLNQNVLHPRLEKLFYFLATRGILWKERVVHEILYRYLRAAVAEFAPLAVCEC